ncbi:MAG: hypothetical protein ACFB21_09940 [Opitutales bacterium]
MIKVVTFLFFGTLVLLSGCGTDQAESEANGTPDSEAEAADGGETAEEAVDAGPAVPPPPAEEPGTPLTMELTAPDAGYRLKIEAVFASGDYVYLVGALSRDADEIAAQVLTPVEDTVEVATESLPPETQRNLCLYLTGDVPPSVNAYPTVASVESLASDIHQPRTLYP